MKQEPQSPTHSLGPPVAYLQHNVNIRNDVIVAGGHCLKSVEMFSWLTKQWTLLPRMTSERYLSSSCIHEGQMFVCRGWGSGTIETLQLKEEGGEWEEFPGKLPQAQKAFSYGHANIIYGQNLFIFGGQSGYNVFNDIYRVCLVSPYISCRLVSHFPEPRVHHGAQRFSDKVAIVGGTTTGDHRGSLDRVLLYDIKRNCCENLAPLPFAICCMATVALGDNIIVIGGVNKNGYKLNTVVSYNVNEQKSKMLPSMKQERVYCTAVVTDNVIIVMGGVDKRGRSLNLVECFNLSKYAWEDLPSMKQERKGATAVVKCVF